MTKCDTIICGHGLAGATLAWQLRWRGQRVVVVDEEECLTSSKIAAGIVTPITGKRINLSWRVSEFLPIARDFYARTAKTLYCSFWHDVSQVWIFKSTEEEDRWQARRNHSQ